MKAVFNKHKLSNLNKHNNNLKVNNKVPLLLLSNNLQTKVNKWIKEIYLISELNLIVVMVKLRLKLELYIYLIRET